MGRRHSINTLRRVCKCNQKRRGRHGEGMSVVKFPDETSTPEAKAAREVRERKDGLAKTCIELDQPIFRAAMLAEIVFDLMWDDNPEGKCREQTAWATMELCGVVREIREIFNADPEKASS